MIPSIRNRTSPHETGNSLVAALLVVSTCVAASTAVVGPSLARHSAAAQDTARETALNLAQSGLDWGLASLRRQGGLLDADFEESLTFAGMGAVEIEYVRGDGNGSDDDGDGTIDEAGEARFSEIRAVGIVNGTRRGARVIVLGPTAAGTPEAAILLNFSAPVASIRGNAFLIDGRDHDQDGNSIAGAASVPALGTGGTAAQLIDQIAPNLHDQIIGAGGSPSVEERPLQDMDALVSSAMAGGYAEILPGTYPGQTLGLDSPAGVTPVSHCNGDLHLAGTSGGAGTLIVEGDLHISGDFTWTGTILVRGTLKLTGGGKTKRLLGAVVVGDGIAGTAFSSVDISSMTPEELAEIDQYNQSVYETTVTSETYTIWDESSGSWVQVAPDSDEYQKMLLDSQDATFGTGTEETTTVLEPPTQVTETVTVEEKDWVPEPELEWIADNTMPDGGVWVEKGQTKTYSTDSDYYEDTRKTYEIHPDCTWVSAPNMEGGGYYANNTAGSWVTTSTSTQTVLVQGVDPILELSGNVEILYSRELALAATAMAAPQMDVLVWTEFGVND